MKIFRNNLRNIKRCDISFRIKIYKCKMQKIKFVQTCRLKWWENLKYFYQWCWIWISSKKGLEFLNFNYWFPLHDKNETIYLSSQEIYSGKTFLEFGKSILLLKNVVQSFQREYCFYFKCKSKMQNSLER